jgi:hypothetical protein
MKNNSSSSSLLTLVLLFLALESALAQAPKILGVRFNRLETATGITLENGYLLIQDGKILFLSESHKKFTKKEAQEQAPIEWLEAQAEWILPGWVHPWFEGGVLATANTLEKPEIWDDSFHPYDPQYRKAFEAGFTTLNLVPPGRGFVGKTRILQVGEGTTPRFNLHPQKGVPVLRFYPGNFSMIEKKIEELGKLKPAQWKEKKYEELQVYQEVFEKKAPWIVEITLPHLASLFLKQERSATLLLEGRSYHLTSLLEKYTASLLLTPQILYDYVSEIHRIPAVELALPQRQMGLIPSQTQGEELEDFRLNCATLIKYGYSRQALLTAMTLNNAKILQMESEVGSLEKGKQANFLIFNGDPFALTSRLEKVYLEGKAFYSLKKP